MRTPSTIIFPMPDRVAEMQRLWRSNDLCLDDLTLERYTDEVIDGVVSCLDHQNVAHTQLMSLADKIKHLEAYHGHDAAFTVRNAGEVYKLGMDFLNLFEEHRLYLNGKFDYVYSGRCSNKEIILIHYA